MIIHSLFKDLRIKFSLVNHIFELKFNNGGRRRNMTKKEPIFLSETKSMIKKGFYKTKIQSIATEANIAPGKVYLLFLRVKRVYVTVFSSPGIKNKMDLYIINYFDSTKMNEFSFNHINVFTQEKINQEGNRMN